jgi:hypothetical protein
MEGGPAGVSAAVALLLHHFRAQPRDVPRVALLEALLIRQESLLGPFPPFFAPTGHGQLVQLTRRGGDTQNRQVQGVGRA